MINVIMKRMKCFTVAIPIAIGTIFYIITSCSHHAHIRHGEVV